MTEADRLLEVELAEKLLTSLLGLAAIHLRKAPDREQVAALLADLEGGRGGLRFVVSASGLGAHIDGAVVSPSTRLTRDFMSLRLAPTSLQPAPPAEGAGPVEHLGAIFSALGESSLASHIPAAARQHLREAISAKVLKGGSLDQHAGLAARGVKDLSGYLDLYNRDVELFAALEAVAVDGAKVSPWERCTRLAPLITSFARSDWPANCHLNEAPAGWPVWKCALFRAAKNAPGSTRRDPKLPTTPNGLHRLLKSNTPFSVSGAGVKVLAEHRRTNASDTPQHLVFPPP